MVCECVFHLVDTVNIRSKVNDGSNQSKNTWQQIRAIYTKEGLFGFGKGFSACFYGSIFCGFSYFFLYKFMKLTLYERYGENINPTYVFLISSMTAETLTIIVHFPYDLIKCRLQSRNYIFKYKNLPHAFRKEIRNNGVLSLYQGALPFLLTYSTFVGLQFTIYERMTKYYKSLYSEQEFKDREMSVNFKCGLVAGSIAAGITNPLECLTVNKQTGGKDFSIKQFIKEEGVKNICLKGIGPRIAYNAFQSVLFFSAVLKLGKLYNVELGED
uniref:Mitochondrial carrier protein n=1 Tax=Strombidium rassoulzadegani TaxID=1082188 RepID=A0A7S3CRB4_9SPIT|mmetsp:Transcript_4426/g.7535  ORF Transcript_4426/g.7535 Transcript_4426/m.7535 type:complete len:271 (+) Transcript_4426:236-1048(+)